MMSVINDSIKQFLAGIATIMHIHVYLGQVLYIVFCMAVARGPVPDL